MALAKVLARDWTIEINTGDETTPAWTAIKGLSTLTFSNSKNDVDTTTYDSAGDEEHMVASRSKGLTMEGYFLEDKTTGDRDPGQEAVELIAEKKGAESLGDFRRVSPGGTEKYFKASVNLNEQGGGNDDATTWGAELNVSGKLYDAYPMV